MKNARKASTFTRIHFRKFVWWGSDDQLFNLYSFLYKSDRIKCDYILFESHFRNDLPIPESIVWFETESELIHIFSDLAKSFMIPHQKNSCLLVCHHFCKPDGTKFNSRSFSTFKTRDKSFIVSKFIEELFKRAGILLMQIE